MEIREAIKDIKEKSNKNFTQTIDLAVNLKHVDIDKNPIDVEIQLPNGRGKELTVGIISDTVTTDAKKVTDVVVTKDEISGIDNKKARKLAKKCDFFLAEPTTMALVGKHLGQILGPRGKMPKPLPPGAPLESMVNNLQNTIKLKAKKHPILQTVIGTEEMPDEEVEENLKRVLEAIQSNLPRGREQIKSVYVKTTMGKPVEVDF